MFTMPLSWKRLSPFHDDRVAFEIGMNVCEKQARILVFAAIRRAAEVARDCDRTGAKCVPYSVTHYDYVQRAHEVRHAIRAAIGSEKA
jgi:hypothetical protein